MEKISLYDFLSVLLPGALLTLAIKTTIPDAYLGIEKIKLNNYFLLTVFLSMALFLGSCINVLTRNLLDLYKRFGIHTPLKKIYDEKLNDLAIIKPFFTQMMQSLDIESTSENVRFYALWDIIYFELESTNTIAPSKAFQSFYFFFRNFFTLGFFLFLLMGISMLMHGFSTKYIPLIITNLTMIFLSILAGEWNRKKMVERIFWTYYSLHKNK